MCRIINAFLYPTPAFLVWHHCSAKNSKVAHEEIFVGSTSVTINLNRYFKRKKIIASVFLISSLFDIFSIFFFNIMNTYNHPNTPLVV